MSRQLASRLARRQGKKIIRQSALTMALALVGLLLFVFVLMPQLVQLFFRIIGNGDLNFKQADTVPPQVPIVSLLPEATKETTLDLAGYGEVDSQVVVVLNGEEITKTTVDSAGQFSYTLDLVDGENVIGFYGLDEAGNESSSKTVVVVRDSQAPSLAFEDLEDGQRITLRQNQTLQIRGETEPGSTLSLNDRNVYVASDGTFSTSFYLQEGDNTLKFVALDKAGNQTERSVRINFGY